MLGDFFTKNKNVAEVARNYLYQGLTLFLKIVRTEGG